MSVPIAESWSPINPHLSLALYRKAARKVGGSQSFNGYVVGLICADLGRRMEELDYSPRPRAWKIPKAKAFRHLVLLPPALHEALRGKLAALPYPVALDAYVRRLIENDVVVP